jgi:peptide/nickel transport system substrate-binding protein
MTFWRDRAIRCALTAAMALLLTPLTPQAQDLTIGVAALSTSVDPHFYNLAANVTLSLHIFDRLTQRAPDSSLRPGLAVAWQPVSDTVWEFKLRPDVHWSDGAAFTADDVAFTIARARNVPNSPSSFAGFLRAITAVEVIDPLTVHFHTAAPAPNVPIDLATIAIVSRHAGQGATTDDYNTGRAAMGTGPYRLVHYEPGASVALVRNDAWWGSKPEWQRVTFRGIPNAGARVAALLAGDVDLIDQPPLADLKRLKADKRIAVFEAQGLRVIFLGPDYTRQGEEPFITDNAGAKLAKNPLLDRRVREALSVAINRQGLVDQVMQGAATPTGQWMPAGTPGYLPDYPVPKYDPARARQLLAEAGFPQGFHLTLHTPNDRYPNDTATSQAVAQMWTRVGIATSVEVLPGAVYAPRGVQHGYSMGLWGWSNNTAEAGSALINIFGTQDAKAGRGVSNVAGYTNPSLDALTDRALATLDDAKRAALFREATRMVSDDIAMITLFHLVNPWAGRAGLTYQARADEQTYAVDVHAAK